MWFSPLPCYVDHLRPKYFPIPKHPQPTFLPQCERPSLTPIQNNRQNYSSVYLQLYIFGVPKYQHIHILQLHTPIRRIVVLRFIPYDLKMLRKHGLEYTVQQIPVILTSRGDTVVIRVDLIDDFDLWNEITFHHVTSNRSYPHITDSSALTL